MDGWCVSIYLSVLKGTVLGGMKEDVRFLHVMSKFLENKSLVARKTFGIASLLGAGWLALWLLSTGSRYLFTLSNASPSSSSPSSLQVSGCGCGTAIAWEPVRFSSRLPTV